MKYLLLLVVAVMLTGCSGCPSYSKNPRGHNQCWERIREDNRLRAAAPQININTGSGSSYCYMSNGMMHCF
jgi:PBP1b-binding outer membrane lipoprotein LpoB